MINEARALELLAEVNPVPDLESYDLSEADLAAHLATLDERSSEMTQLNTRTSPPTGPKSRLRLALVGGLAAVLAVTVTFIALTGNDSSEFAGNGDLVSADFVGTWTVPVEGVSALFIYFDESGRYILSDSFGSFEERAIEKGAWTFDGEEFVFITDDSSSSCVGTVGRYGAQRLDDERILLIPVEPDPCVDRQEGIGLGAFRSYPLDPEFSNE